MASQDSEQRLSNYQGYFSYSLFEVSDKNELAFYNCLMLKDALNYKKGDILKYIVIGTSKSQWKWVNHYTDENNTDLMLF
jgi:hypothetical protein